MARDCHDRPHELTLRELAAEFVGFKRLMDERKEAVNNSFVALEKQTNMSFAASEKAIVKAEDSQRAYNASHNDLLRKQEAMITRPEFDSLVKVTNDKIDEIKKDITALREYRSESSGRTTQASGDRERSQFLVTLAIGVVSSMIGAAVAIVAVLTFISKMKL